MSAIAGMYRFDGAPLDRVWLASAGAALTRHGPDGGREAVAGAVGMAYRAFNTTPQSAREHQPSTRTGVGLLAWDGRLDNRGELRVCLDAAVATDDTDVEYVWAAYERWGCAMLGRLIGDFALALWDARSRTLLLARDCVGTRPLHYHVDSRRIIWSTDLGVLLHTGGVPIEVNDEYVAGFLCRGPDTHLTPYVNVHAVKPAHAVVVREGRLSTECFWRLDPDRELHYAHDAEYEDHFRQLFRESVRARLRSGATVFAELSGGLDSSSIVCMADSVLASGDAAAKRLETISYVFDECGTTAERRWIAHVEAHRGVSSHYVTGSEHPFLQPNPTPSRFATPSFAIVHNAFLAEMVRHMRSCGARVVLSGMAGDELLHSTNDPDPELSDLLQQGRLLRLHQRTHLWSRLLKRPYLDLLWRGAVWPLLPGALREALAPEARRPPAWIAPAFARRTSLGRRMVDPPDLAEFKQASRRDQAAGFRSVVRRIASGQRQEVSGFAMAYPYLDRRLVEFLQAIPFDQKVRPGESRSLMRRALRDLLPPPIAARRGKDNPAEIIARAIARDFSVWHTLLERGRLVERGYADPRHLSEALSHARVGWKQSAALFNAIVLESWLRGVEERRATGFREIVADRMPAAAATIPDGAAS